MNIQNENELAHSIAVLSDMYRQRERSLAEASWTPSGREAAAESIAATIRKIRREVYEYLLQEYEPCQQPVDERLPTELEKELVA